MPKKPFIGGILCDFTFTGIRAGILHCEKNCYSECLSAGIGFDKFKKLCDSCGIEDAAWNTSFYFKCFEALLRLRERL